jgi:tRNA A37 N6-isopentenylltransferase MiaA
LRAKRQSNWIRRRLDQLWTKDVDLALSLLRPFNSFIILNATDTEYRKLVKAIRNRQAKTKDRYCHAWCEEGVRVWRIQ